MADLSAFLAMSHCTGMLFTFLCTCVAYIGAHLAYFFVELSITCKHFGGQHANIGALKIELYAA